MTTVLTKSDFNAGSQCPKRLYLQKHQPDLGAPAAAGLDRRAEDGIAIGILGRRYYPGGILIEWAGGDTAAQTDIAIKNGVECLYEATFQSESDGVLVRCDILRRIPGSPNEWHMIEVKSGTNAKPEYITDVAFQVNAARAAGLTVSRVSLLHLNNQYLFSGGDYDTTLLFTEVDVMAEVEALLPTIQAATNGFHVLLAGPDIPVVETNRHCDSTPKCEFHDHCHADQPDFDVIQLPRISAKQVTAYRQAGYKTIMDLPEHEVKPQWTTIWSVIRSGEPYFGAALGEELANVQYPIHFIDFESVACGLPVYPQTRPYQQVLFQWSNHIVDAPGEEPRHEELRILIGPDPRASFAETLWESIKDAGTIVVYSSFEASRLRELAADGIPWGSELSDKLSGCVVDILKIVRDHIYHPAFKGSYSVKKVLPALVPDLSYAALPIHDGDTASLRYLEMQGFRPTGPDFRRNCRALT